MRQLKVLIFYMAMMGPLMGGGEEVGQSGTGGRIRLLQVSLEEVDALELQFGLPELLAHLEKQLGQVDRPEARQRKWKLVRAYYGYRATRQEIGLLRKKQETIEALCALDSILVANAQVPDEQWLSARNEVISQRIALLNKIVQCRLFLLEILEASNAEILSHESAQGKTAANPD